jgi:hypothetical protein
MLNSSCFLLGEHVASMGERAICSKYTYKGVEKVSGAS